MGSCGDGHRPRLAARQWYDGDSSEYYLIRSLIGSKINLVEYMGQKVTGTLAKCDRDQLHISGTEIRDPTTRKNLYFGDYTLYIHEIKKWRLLDFVPRVADKNGRSVHNIFRNSGPSAVR